MLSTSQTSQLRRARLFWHEARSFKERVGARKGLLGDKREEGGSKKTGRGLGGDIVGTTSESSGTLVARLPYRKLLVPDELRTAGSPGQMMKDEI